MLVLAPDPRSGIAPDRVARVRALLDGARTATGTTIPGVVVALPGGPDGLLDALVLRPDGVLGLVPVPDRVTASTGSTGSTGSAPSPTSSSPSSVRSASSVTASGGASDPTSGPASDPTSGPAFDEDPPDVPREAAEAEIDRLLALPDPGLTGPRRALPAAAPVGSQTRSALLAPVGSFRVLGADDVRRALTAFRLADHIPGDVELSRAGFPTRPSIPRARTSTPSSPSLPPVPVTEPVPHMGRNPERDGGLGGTASFPATGALALDPSRPPRRRATRRVPGWVWGWPGLTVAAVAAFAVALGVAVGIGKAVGASSATAGGTAPVAATRDLDGVPFARRDTTLDLTCEGHAYGQVVQFLRERPCVRLERSLWTGSVAGRDTMISVATVQMADATAASALKSLVDTSGTGNVAELVREGRGFPGAPPTFTSAGYASMLLGDRVVIAEADAVDPSVGDRATLDRLATSGLALR